MELVTDKTKIWYFPPDSEDDVPRYSMQTERDENGEFVLYDEIHNLTIDDSLKIQPLKVNSDQMQVNFRNQSIGLVNCDDDVNEAKFREFVTQWKNGIKFIETLNNDSADGINQLKKQRQLEEKKRQKIQLFKFLCDNLKNYIKPNDLNVRIITWNLQGKSYKNFDDKDVLSFKKLLGISDLVKKNDIYVINLQETVILNTLSFYSSPMIVNEWTNYILELLNKDFNDDRPSSSSSNLDTSDRILNEQKDSLKYDYLVDNRLVGLSTIVIVKKHLKKQISNIDVSTTGTGILNMFGNKGAILIKFTFSFDKDILPYLNDTHNELTEEERNQVIHGYEFVIINSHLTAGEQNFTKRKRELQVIERNLNLRDYFKNEAFYLINPLLTNEYYNSNSNNFDGTSGFRFNDSDTIKDSKPIQMEDLTVSTTEDTTSESIKSPNIKSNFQEVTLNNERKSNRDSISSRLASPFLGLAEKFPNSPSLSTFNDNASIKTTNTFYNNKIYGSKTQKVNDCFIFFGGDLNFRSVPLTEELTGEKLTEEEFKNEMKDLIISKRIDSLIERDSLSIEKQNFNVLSGFEEGSIDFLPTYKHKTKEPILETDKIIEEEEEEEEYSTISEESKIGIEDLSINDEPEDDLPFDFSRIPSFTDRIFFCESNNIEDLESDDKHIKVNEYNSVNDLLISDHKPVYLDLTIENLQIIDFDERYKLMKNFLKNIDYQENSKKPIADVSPVDLKIENVKTLNKSTEYEILIKNNGKAKFNWEFVNYNPKKPNLYLNVESSLDTSQLITENYLKEPIVEISPIKGVVPATGVMKIKIKLNSINVGIKKIILSLILRIIGSKDFFLTYEFIPQVSIFGESLDLLNNIKEFGSSSGIPPSIYELINYLSNHLVEEMFNDTYDFNNKTELSKKILNDLDISIREQLENNGTLDKDYISQIEKYDDDNSNIKAVVRTLLLLLNNLDGGIIPKEFATFILDEIQLPSFFQIGGTNKLEQQSDITTKILEFLPGLRANVFMYICSFLTLYTNHFKNCDKNQLVGLFEEALISLPADCPRSLKNKRREVIKLLI